MRVLIPLVVVVVPLFARARAEPQRAGPLLQRSLQHSGNAAPRLRQQWRLFLFFHRNLLQSDAGPDLVKQLVSEDWNKYSLVTAGY